MPPLSVINNLLSKNGVISKMFLLNLKFSLPEKVFSISVILLLDLIRLWGWTLRVIFVFLETSLIISIPYFSSKSSLYFAHDGANKILSVNLL